MEELRKLLNDPFGDCPTLTKREREAANLLAFAYSQDEVAIKLGIKTGSVAALAKRAKKKLDLSSYGKQFARILFERIKEIVG